jgi:hypothetical protein
MSSILNDLGIDQDDLNWQDLAICRGINTNLFYDQYEVDSNIAKSIDEMCLSCPVLKMCHESGISGLEYGVWGGTYLSAGIIDKSRNLHKTEDIWKRLRRKGVA